MPSEAEQRSPAEELARLRDLLLAPDRAAVRAIHRHLDDPVRRAADVAEVLADAVGLASSQGRRLAATLTPVVEEALTASVRKDPRPLGHAIYPVLGPAIRKAISSALSGMIESLNEILERSASVEGLRWRLEAVRSGKPFAEVVLLHTLVFRVEQVLLIHEPSGLLLHHITAPMVQPPDPDLVSGMLTAIRDFVRDSFRVESTAELDLLKAGDLTLWIEPGPVAYLVAVIRGRAPASLRRTLQETLESIHGSCFQALEGFRGDSQSFEMVRPDLERCLKSERVVPCPPARWRVRSLGALLLLLLAAGLAVVIRDQLRWSAYLHRLRDEPGIVVVAEHRGMRRFSVEGLRDPMATDPEALLDQTDVVRARVSSRWQTYQSGEPAFVLQRARTLLQPPPDVQLQMDNGVLTARGHAPHAWAIAARPLTTLLSGVLRYDDQELMDEGRARLARLTEELKKQVVHFDLGSAALQSSEVAVLSEVSQLTRRIIAEAGRLDGAAIIEVIGHTDPIGDTAANEDLARRRADIVSSRLRGETSGEGIVAIGASASAGLAGVQNPTQRSVTFNVRLRPAAKEPDTR